MKKFLLLASVLIGLPGAATAQTIVFINTSAAFNTVAGPTRVEDFEDRALLTGLSITSTTANIAGGVLSDSLAPGVSTTFNFTSGQSAFGGVFDLSFAGQAGLSFTFALLGGGTQTLSQQVPNNCVFCFFGFTSTNPFLSVTLNSGTQGAGGESFTLNNLQIASATTGAVPEPTTWAMMLIGFGGMGVALRRRRKTASISQYA